MNTLFLCHNHPSFHPGGTEIFALDVFRELRRQGMQGLFIGGVDKAHREERPGTVFQGVGDKADEMLLWAGHFQSFFLSQTDLHAIVPELRALLLQQQFEVVHLHHVLLLGLEVLPLIRRTLPNAKIFLTLHDYFPICAADGLMMTVPDKRLCRAASPDKCHKCFPKVDAEQFVLRRLLVENHFAYVDVFLSPSQFLKDRYVEWGLPAEKIQVMANARPDTPLLPPRPLRTGETRNRFAYLGNISPHKGLPVLLDAVRLLAETDSAPFHLAVHGGMPFQTTEFQESIRRDFQALRAHVHATGPYEAEDVPGFMAEADWLIVPSVWWENAPLVIQEAFTHRRPVIATGIGGMAEAVQHNVNGLTFRLGDSYHLAQQMQRALQEEGLWERLAGNITPPWRLAECAAAHAALYQSV